jgi:hypothetical protein
MGHPQLAVAFSSQKSEDGHIALNFKDSNRFAGGEAKKRLNASIFLTRF